VFYFVFFTILGRIFIIGLLISSFQEGFTKSLKETILKDKQKGRLGFIGCMILIDLDLTGKIERDEFLAFVHKINPNLNEDTALRIFKEMLALKNRKGNSNEQQNSLDIKQFVLGIEQTSQAKLENEDFVIRSVLFKISRPIRFQNQINAFLSSFSRFFNRLRIVAYPIVSSSIFEVFVLICIVLQIFVLSLYGTLSDQSSLDLVNTFIVLVNCVELCLKILVYGRAVSLTLF
jgi:hypothetical protein